MVSVVVTDSGTVWAVYATREAAERFIRNEDERWKAGSMRRERMYTIEQFEVLTK